MTNKSDRPDADGLLIAAYDEYIALLTKSEAGMLGLAHVHGYRCPDDLVQRGKELRETIASLKIARATPSPTRDGAEGAGADIEHLKDVGENGYCNMTAGEAYKKGFAAGNAAPPKPAPDAVREAILIKIKNSVRLLYDVRGAGEKIFSADERSIIEKALAAPVPPPDGAACPHDGHPRCCAPDRYPFSPAVPAEPVAWRWRNPDDKSGTWRYVEKEMHEHPLLSLKVEPLFASPTVRRDKP